MATAQDQLKDLLKDHTKVHLDIVTCSGCQKHITPPHMQCPQCKEYAAQIDNLHLSSHPLHVAKAFFCGQDCFKSSWKAHKRVHTQWAEFIEKQQIMTQTEYQKALQAFHQQQDYQEAKAQAEKAIQLFRKSKNRVGEAHAQLLIGHCITQMGIPSEAFYYYDAAVDFFEPATRTQEYSCQELLNLLRGDLTLIHATIALMPGALEVLNAMTGLAMAFMARAECHRTLNQHEQAHIDWMQASALFAGIGDKNQAVHALMLNGTSNIAQKKHALARQAFKQAQQLLESLKLWPDVCRLYWWQGQNEMLDKQFRPAQTHFEMCLNFARKHKLEEFMQLATESIVQLSQLEAAQLLLEHADELHLEQAPTSLSDSMTSSLKKLADSLNISYRMTFFLSLAHTLEQRSLHALALNVLNTVEATIREHSSASEIELFKATVDRLFQATKSAAPSSLDSLGAIKDALLAGNSDFSFKKSQGNETDSDDEKSKSS